MNVVRLHAFRTETEVWAGVALWNHRSIATLERLGFRYLGNNADGYTVSGVPEPFQEFHLTFQQWQSRQCNA
jgi:RimJ/RimL family protein N-acetyltransferase